MGKKKRQRSESFQGKENDEKNARKRLKAFHAKVFELPLETMPEMSHETPCVVLKTKHKKNVTGKRDAIDDGEVVPIVKFNVMKKQQNKVKNTVKDNEKKKKKKEKRMMMNVAIVKTREMSKSKEKKTEKRMTQASTNEHLTTKKNKQQNATGLMIKKTKQVQTGGEQVLQLHSMQTDDAQHDDGVEAVKIMDEIATCQVDTSLHNKHKTVTGKTVAGPKVEKLKKNVEAAEKEGLVTQAVVSDNGGNELPKKLMTKPKKRKKKLRKQATEEAKDKKHVDDRVMHVDKDETNLSGSKNTGAALRENGSLTAAISATSSSKSSAKRKNRSKVATTTSSVLPTVHASVQPSEDTALTVSSIPEKQLGSDAAKCVNKVVPKITEKVREKKAKTGSKSAAARSTKAGSNDEKNTAESPTSLTPIAASLVKAAKKKKNDMFLSKQEETSRQSPVSSKRIEKAAILQVADEVSSESEDDGKSDSDHSDGDKMSLFSRLIDSAAREQWQLVEVGRLVRLFAAEWDFKGSKTARFLCKTCPELVNVDFVEGLGVSLSAKQLVQVFEAGSGNSRVLMNKLASAVENGDLSVRDPAFVSALEQRVALMESNAEVMELLYPLLESLSTVRDVSYLIKQLCEHWQLERKIALVQQVLLSSVFDDLDGNQDDILLDLPDLTGRLDFPSRLDQEDVDENGNLKGFLANDDSDCDEEGELKEDIDADASEDDEDLHDDETDSEEEVEISGRSWGRNQFVEDEADVGDEDDDVDEEERLDDDASSSTNTD